MGGCHLRFVSVSPSQGKSICSFYYLFIWHHVKSWYKPQNFAYLLELFFCQEPFRYVYNIKITIKNSMLCNIKLKKLEKTGVH